MNTLKNYRTSLILVGSIILGGITGLVFGPSAMVLQPIGQLFLNCRFMVITPLVFFCVAAAVVNMTGAKRVGHTFGAVVVVFVVTSVIAGVVGLVGFLAVPPLASSDVEAVKAAMGAAEDVTQGSVGAQIVGTFTVSDFKDLLS